MLAREVDMKTAIYGHVSEETAYLVEDYPYGFKLRCKMRYWLEYKPGTGTRLVSQTTNPKKGDRWNTPKKSTYASVTGCMYLDENNHVHWDAIHVSDSISRLEEFINNFPGAARIEVVQKLLEHYRKAK